MTEWLSWTENSITKENLQYVINGFNILCKWILLGKLREEAEQQLTSGLYKKCLGKKTGRIPPNCAWWLFLDGRTPGGFSSCSYVFIYSFMYFLNFLQTAWGQLFFSGCFGVQWEKKEKQGRSDEHERKVKRHCYVKDKPTGLGLGPLRNFIFLAVHSFSNSLFSYIFIKIQRRPKWRRFSSCPQAASSYLQPVHHKGRGELDKSCMLRINCKKN